jgi:hypothetical protein
MVKSLTVGQENPFGKRKKKNLASRGRWRKKKIRFFSETLCLLQVINM